MLSNALLDSCPIRSNDSIFSFAALLASDARTFSSCTMGFAYLSCMPSSAFKASIAACFYSAVIEVAGAAAVLALA